MTVLEGWRRSRDARLCRQAHARLQQIVDGEVPPGRWRSRLERHIERCTPCHADADTIRDLKAAVARVVSQPDPSVKARLLAVVEDVRCGAVSPPAPDTPDTRGGPDGGEAAGPRSS